jgi:Tol biopolymer transport system component
MIEPGAHVGPFEVLGRLGAGGMGEVYRARDRRLGREVALKVLPERLADDPGRLAAFEREARILASLSHPGIAVLYGVERCEGGSSLVLELVRGETLAERLRRGPLLLPEALRVCRDIAEALEAAHAQGIVHRDLKCANVMLTTAGLVKVLDFGLAEVVADALGPDPELSTRPPQGDGGMAGAGTAAYMSPEQARGQAVDARADIWSFGCVLYETLTGRPVFRGETFSDRLAAVLTAEPDWSALPAEAPESVHRLLRRCLERDVRRRIHHIADARLEIDEATREAGAAPPPGRSAARLRRAAGIVAVVAIAGLLWTVWAERTSVWSEPRPLRRLNVDLPAGLEFADQRSGSQTALALSPDGKSLVFAAGSSGHRQLYLRPLDQLDAAAVRGTEGGDHPFFSPDGRWLGFTAEGKLKKVPVEGGDPVTLCDAPTLRGASWVADGTIVFAPSVWGGLWRVSAFGGAARPLTTPDGEREVSHRWPHVLPDGRSALFSALSASCREDERTIAVVSLETGRTRALVRGGSYPRYAPSGHLVYARAGSLMAVRFDSGSLSIHGPPVPALEDVRMWPKTSGLAYFDVSPQGLLVYVPGYPRPPDRDLVWVDRKGRMEPLAQPARPYATPVLSGDGRRLAVTVEGPDNEIWVHDFDRNTWTRLTSEGDNNNPVWSPDGARVAFSSNRRGPRNIFWAPIDGSREAEALSHGPDWHLPASFTPDGKTVLFAYLSATSDLDIWTLSLSGERKMQPLLSTPVIEDFPALSPDGRWLAYVSAESRREEVYVRAYPGPGPRWPISVEGGSQPVWARSGRELFYRHGDKMMAVPVTTRPGFRAGAPLVLFEAELDEQGAAANYAVTPDAQRFLMIKAPHQEMAPLRIAVVPDWIDELRRKVR